MRLQATRLRSASRGSDRHHGVVGLFLDLDASEERAGHRQRSWAYLHGPPQHTPIVPLCPGKLRRHMGLLRLTAAPGAVWNPRMISDALSGAPRLDSIVPDEALVGLVQDNLALSGWKMTPVFRLSQTILTATPPKNLKTQTRQWSHEACSCQESLDIGILGIRQDGDERVCLCLLAGKRVDQLHGRPRPIHLHHLPGLSPVAATPRERGVADGNGVLECRRRRTLPREAPGQPLSLCRPCMDVVPARRCNRAFRSNFLRVQHRTHAGIVGQAHLLPSDAAPGHLVQDVFDGVTGNLANPRNPHADIPFAKSPMMSFALFCLAIFCFIPLIGLA